MYQTAGNLLFFWSAIYRLVDFFSVFTSVCLFLQLSLVFLMLWLLMFIAKQFKVFYIFFKCIEWKSTKLNIVYCYQCYKPGLYIRDPVTYSFVSNLLCCSMNYTSVDYSCWYNTRVSCTILSFMHLYYSMKSLRITQ